MSTDPEIQFGELEEEQPDIELRPDRNAHYAVVPYGEPQEGELPIFVDLDTLIEMESHALDDTTVELGGVMLGGQCVDEDGDPFVVVLDSLRAEHFEATKGSFKFTHDTFAKFTRQRENYPEQWDQVGWYHTHPDWGVFLSGMDMFICDNHFNKQLDVALVIDPCRQDRGFFYWTGDPRERKRRVSGFYVIASRHRQAELEQFVAELEGGYTMRTDPNLRGNYGVTSGGGAPTVVNITEQRPGWMGQAIVGLMFVQTLMLLMIAYMALAPRPPEQEKGDKAASVAQKERELKIKTEVLDQVFASMADKKDVVSDFQERQVEADKVKNDLAAYEIAVPVLKEQKKRLDEDLKKSEKSAREWKESYKEKVDQYKKVKSELTALKAKDDDDGPKEKDETQPLYKVFTTWPGILVVSVVVVFLVGGSAMIMKAYAGQDEFPEDAYDDLPENDVGHTDAGAEGDGEFRMDDESAGEDPASDDTASGDPPADDTPRT